MWLAAEAARGLLLAAALILVLLTLLPAWRSPAWWVRVWDFPRPQIAGLLALAIPAAALAFGTGGIGGMALLGALGLALGVQLRRIWPFTPLHPPQAEAVPEGAPGECLTLLVANLKLRNSGAERLLALVERLRPDLVFVVELDSDGAEALEPLKPAFPHHLVHPRPDFWGMALYARLPLVRPEVRFLLEDDVPSLRAGVRLASGAVVAFQGVHPKPPMLFGHGTSQRDAELLLAARDVGGGARPAVLAGDLNAVAWSRETALFMRAGGLLDPRIGRGLFPTFPARWPSPLRWPLDHVFFSGEFGLRRIVRLPDIGSDHLPLLAELCLRPGPPRAEPRPRPGDAAAIAAAIAAGRRAAAADRRLSPEAPLG